MELKTGKYTLESFARQNDLTKGSALNLLTKLKKRCYVKVSGGGKQKRIYTVYNKPTRDPNGFYTLVNKYSPEKLIPKFKHYTIGRYTIEQAVIDGIKIGDARTLDATKHLFRHIQNWKRLFDIAKKYKVEKKVVTLYKGAVKEMKCKRIPRRYL